MNVDPWRRNNSLSGSKRFRDMNDSKADEQETTMKCVRDSERSSILTDGNATLPSNKGTASSEANGLLSSALTSL